MADSVNSSDTSTNDCLGKQDGPRAVRRHDIRDGIQNMILEGELTSGQRLGQKDLAERFGVAQGLVREALLELQAFGLVEIVDNRGVFVRQLDADAVIEAIQIREMHEALAVRLCCEHTTRKDLAGLKELAEKMHRLGLEGKKSEMAWLDRQFHHRLLELSGNKMLIRVADTYLMLGKVVRSDRDPNEVRKEHFALLEAIEQGHADQAEKLVRDHIKAAEESLAHQIEQGEQVPKWLGKNS